MRFHLIDRVVSYEPGKAVHGRKLTSLSEEYWEETPEGLRMPPPLALEALCQAGTWLIMITTERQKRAALLSIGSVEFNADVRPGDVIELLGHVESMSDEVAVLSGTATVDGTVVMEAKDIMCALIDVETLAPLEDTKRLQGVMWRG